MKRRKMITGKGMEKSHPQDEISKKMIDHFMVIDSFLDRISSFNSIIRLALKVLLIFLHAQVYQMIP